MQFLVSKNGSKSSQNAEIYKNFRLCSLSCLFSKRTFGRFREKDVGNFEQRKQFPGTLNKPTFLLLWFFTLCTISADFRKLEGLKRSKTNELAKHYAFLEKMLQRLILTPNKWRNRKILNLQTYIGNFRETIETFREKEFENFQQQMKLVKSQKLPLLGILSDSRANLQTFRRLKD